MTYYREKCYNDDPPFMAILPTMDLFGTPIMDIQGLKSEFRIFCVADYASGRKVSFLPFKIIFFQFFADFIVL